MGLKTRADEEGISREQALQLVADAIDADPSRRLGMHKMRHQILVEKGVHLKR